MSFSWAFSVRSSTIIIGDITNPIAIAKAAVTISRNLTATGKHERYRGEKVDPVRVSFGPSDVGEEAGKTVRKWATAGDKL